MNSSTSNFNWKDYWRRFLKVAACASALIFALILFVDPYDTLFFSPSLDRAPMATNQRFSYPVLARNPKFDSAVIGSSSVRLFRPELLNKLFDAHFVNLAANATRPYEQYRFLKLFSKHHPDPKVILFGIDIKNNDMWCLTDKVEQFTDREFPEWMFDDNEWNDALYHFNAKALEITGRQVAQLAGFMKPRFGPDGFDDFTSGNEYDLKKARKNIYGQEEPKEKPPSPKKPELSAEDRKNLNFPALVYLEDMLNLLPSETIKILHFVPRHWYVQPQRNTKDAIILDECKARIRKITNKYENTHIFDFMMKSPITVKDTNYWDDIHHNIKIADDIIKMEADQVLMNKMKNGYYLYYQK